MTMSSQGRIIIAGAGVAGLSAALELAARGWDIDIFDKAGELSEVGAGLQLAPNAMRHLLRLGVAEELLPKAVTPDALYLVDGKSARPLLQMQLGTNANRRWHYPYIVCHRADLQSALYAVANRQSNIRFHFGHEISAHEVSASGVEVTSLAGDVTQKHQADYFICCDGVWSKQRQSAGLGAAQFSGYIAWRATIASNVLPASFSRALPQTKSVSAWLGKQSHFIAYPVKSGAAYNFVAITEGSDPGKDWSRRGDAKQLLQHFPNWSEAVRDVLQQAEAWTYWPLFQMPSAEFVVNDRIILLGDASHAVTPFAAQGAAMAIEDAAALAEALSQSPLALQNFDRIRKQRLKTVAKRGAMNRFAYHASGPLALGRNALFALRSPDSFLKDLDWLYAYDAVAALRS